MRLLETRLLLKFTTLKLAKLKIFPETLGRYCLK